MSGTGLVANVAGGVIALSLLIYLVYALIRPEKF
ncbi:K(+)-transporting ATPase subunit F [Amycolatopsis pigmentata]|uniref:K(+)-transporting ATPase subunit F n=1 Tax=Amycolatopsis pigmentata TaxID=450801 RepID=A0ABW5FWW9_9PSEU